MEKKTYEREGVALFSAKLNFLLCPDVFCNQIISVHKSLKMKKTIDLPHLPVLKPYLLTGDEKEKETGHRIEWSASVFRKQCKKIAPRRHPLVCPRLHLSGKRPSRE